MVMINQKPTFFFDPYARPPKAPDTATTWLVRGFHGDCLGVVEKAGDNRFAAHRNGKFIGSYPTKHAAGTALEQADAQEAGA